MYEILRYAQGASRIEIEVDGYLNHHFVTTPSDPVGDHPRLMLEAQSDHRPAGPVGRDDHSGGIDEGGPRQQPMA